MSAAITECANGGGGGDDGGDISAQKVSPPRYPSIQQGINQVANGKTVFVAGGTYNQDAQLYQNATIRLSGDVTIGGSLYLYNGQMISTPDTFCL